MIKVISTGLYTTFQDLGRFKYRNLGVPLSGAMDQYSARLANRLVGNKPNATLLEITLVGPVLKFDVATQIAITGAGFSPTLNNVEIPLNTKVNVLENNILKFGLSAFGVRAYISIPGGFIAEEVMGSTSQYSGITKNKTLGKEDIFFIKSDIEKSITTASVKVSKSKFNDCEITVFKGPDFYLLPKEFQDKISHIELVVNSQSNRMAYMLESLENVSATEIITAPVQPGTVQLTPSGQCIVLMRDAQTTGGYARILQLTDQAMDLLSQKRSGEKIKFLLK